MERSRCSNSRCEIDNRTSERKDNVVLTEAIKMKRLAKQCNQTTASNQDTTSYERTPTDPRNPELYGVHEHENDHGLAKG